MEPKKKIGIDITEADGTPLACGLEFYWDAGLSQILMQEASDFCPDVEFNQKDERSFETRFHKDTDKGVELCGTSKSLENRRVRIPESDLDKFIAAIDQLHAKSERPGIPTDNKAFMHDFVVPNPLSMKSAWRVTTGFTQRLLVLWGYTAPASDAVILPLTPTSAKWDDASRRTDLKDLLTKAGLITTTKMNLPKILCTLGWVLLILLLLLLLYLGITGVVDHRCVTCSKETSFSFRNFPYMCERCSLPEKECTCMKQGNQQGGQQGGDQQGGQQGGDQQGGNQQGDLQGSNQQGGQQGGVQQGGQKGGDKQGGQQGGDQQGGQQGGDQQGGQQGGDQQGGQQGGDQQGNQQGGQQGGDQQGGNQQGDLQGSNQQGGQQGGDQQGDNQQGDLQGSNQQGGQQGGVQQGGQQGGDQQGGQQGGDQQGRQQGGDQQGGQQGGDQQGGQQGGDQQGNQQGGQQGGDQQGGNQQGDLQGSNQQGGQQGSQQGGREKVPAIADYTFSVQLKQKTVNGDLVDATFTVVPDKCVGNTTFTVNSWLINGDPKQSGDKKNFSAKLSYKKRYVITAIVTVNGKEQKVLPYQWNSVDTPVWMISRIGNKDNEYQVLCTNSSNTRFKVVKWSQPLFQDGKKENISAKFKCTSPVLIGDNKVRFTWSQDHMGEYIVTLEAQVGVFSENGAKTGETQVSNSFVFINGSRAQALISQKFDNAKDRIYHCLATNMDGTQHNGTAFAVTDKLLLTNYHVAVGNIPEYYRGEETKVDPSKLLVLSNEKGMFYAKVIKSDRATDMALLKLCDKNGRDTDAVLPEYFIVAESEPALNARVFSVGYPAGTTKFGEPAFSDGKIEHCENAGKRGEIICHFSNIQPGYSGGPLVYMDKDSVIIGVNASGIVTDTPAKQGANFATSATEIRKKFPEIFSAGR